MVLPVLNVSGRCLYIFTYTAQAFLQNLHHLLHFHVTDDITRRQGFISRKNLRAIKMPQKDSKLRFVIYWPSAIPGMVVNNNLSNN